MKGSIRFFAGLLIMFGAVGTLEIDNEASVLVQVGVALIGAAVAYSGVRAFNKNEIVQRTNLGV